MFSIGQTGRTCQERFKEHIKALTTTSESSFSNHLIEINHQYTGLKTNMTHYIFAIKDE